MVQVLISIDFIKNFQKFNRFTVDDFDKSHEIDIESFYFIKQLLFTNKSEWHVSLPADKIFYYIQTEISKISNDEKETAYIIKCYGQNTIKSGITLYKKIQIEEYNNIDRNNLPNYIFLGDVCELFCKKVEDELGIICLSKQRMKLGYGRRNVVLKQIPNTTKALFNQLNLIPHNTLTIIDDYFFTNFGKLDSELGRIFLSNIKNSVKDIKVKCNEEGNSVNIKKQNEQLKNSKDVKFVMKIIHHPGKFHDRYIFTNSSIILLGNSLLRNTACYYSQFPLGLYADFFEDAIRLHH